MTTRRARGYPYVLAAVTALDLILIAADEPKLTGLARLLGYSPDDSSAPWWTWIAGLRGWAPPEGMFTWEASWSWIYVASPAPLVRWLTFFAIGVAGAIALMFIDRWDRVRRSSLKVALALSVMVVAGWSLENSAVAIRAPNPFQEVAELVQNPGFGGYLFCAEHLPRLEELFSRYVLILSYHPESGHCSQHPPGGVMLFWVVMHFLEALPSARLGGLYHLVLSWLRVTPLLSEEPVYLVDFLSALIGGQLILLGAASVVVPCFFAANRLAGRAAALRLSALALVVPSVILMSPTFDQLFATITAWLLVFLLEGLDRRPLLFGALGGLAAAAGLFFSYAFFILVLPVIAILAGRAVQAHWTNDLPEKARVIKVSVMMGLIVGICWLTLWQVAGFDFPGSMKLATGLHDDFNHRRPYRVWALLNLVDFIQHLGPPLAMVALIGLFSRGSAQRVLTANGSPSMTGDLLIEARRASLLLSLFWAFLLALDLAGWNRGEVARLWILIIPLCLFGLFQAIGRGMLGPRTLGTLAACQFLVCAAMARYWRNFS